MNLTPFLGGAIFLATVDDRVSKQALDEMQVAGIGLVVPESLKSSNETFYPTHPNVMSFKRFFEDEIAGTRPFFLTAPSGTGSGSLFE